MREVLMVIVVLASFAGMVWSYFVWPFRLNRKLKQTDPISSSFRFGYFISVHYLFFAALTFIFFLAVMFDPGLGNVSPIFAWYFLGAGIVAGALGFGMLRRYRIAWGIIVALIWIMTVVGAVITGVGPLESPLWLVIPNTVGSAVIATLITIYVKRRWQEFR